MTWLELILHCTSEAESPARFQYWSALAAVSAIAKKNVFINRYIYKLYPNIYVILVGKSGLRKGNPVTLSKNMVLTANSTRIMAGRNSVQSIIKELGKAKSLESGGIIKEASAFIVSGEMDAFFIKDPDAMTVLTDLYDTHAHEPEWKNTTKTQGTNILKNPCITLLGGTNEDHFKSAIAEKDVRGGFIARTIIVFESKRRLINDLTERPSIVPNVKELAAHLTKISEMKGEVKLTPEAKSIYRPWYKDMSLLEHDDTTGTIERIGDTVLKVAMLIALTSEMMCITGEHMQEAIDRCMECLAGLRYVVMGAAKNETAEFTGRVLKYLLAREDHQASKRQALSKFWGEGIDSVTLDRIIETLMQAGAIDVIIAAKGEVFYKVKAAHVEAYQKFKKEIN